MTSVPQTREQVSTHIPALHLLCNLGTADCLRLRGGTREVLIKPRLIEVLQRRRFEYKGESSPPSNCPRSGERLMTRTVFYISRRHAIFSSLRGGFDGSAEFGIIDATQPPRLCFCKRNLGGFSFSAVEKS